MISLLVSQPQTKHDDSWWRHQMETFSALLALSAGNSMVTSEFPSQRPVTWSFDVFLDLRLNKRLIRQSWGWLFETPWRSLWRHCNVCYARMSNIWKINVQQFTSFPFRQFLFPTGQGPYKIATSARERLISLLVFPTLSRDPLEGTGRLFIKSATYLTHLRY